MPIGALRACHVVSFFFLFRLFALSVSDAPESADKNKSVCFALSRVDVLRANYGSSSVGVRKERGVG